MPSDFETQEDIEEKKPRITVKLDEFDHKVVSRMAINRNISLSNTMRNIVHDWIENNPELLKRNYGVNIKEVSDEIFSETASLALDKSLKDIEMDIIKELPGFFELVEVVNIEDLADHFNVPDKLIKRIIFTHGKEIRKINLNLILKEGKIFKE
ncbi:MAG: hypothetical protein ACFE9I_16835 [Candidatus Hermodarchaeota archaeon]